MMRTKDFWRRLMHIIVSWSYVTGHRRTWQGRARGAGQGIADVAGYRRRGRVWYGAVHHQVNHTVMKSGTCTRAVHPSKVAGWSSVLMRGNAMKMKMKMKMIFSWRWRWYLAEVVTERTVSWQGVQCRSVFNEALIGMDANWLTMLDCYEALWRQCTPLWEAAPLLSQFLGTAVASADSEKERRKLSNYTSETMAQNAVATVR